MCPLISDPAARERLLKIREANFRLRRGRRRANLRKNRTDKDVKQAVVLRQTVTTIPKFEIST